MRYWERCIDKLMSIPYGWQVFAERLAAWARESIGADVYNVMSRFITVTTRRRTV